MSNGNSNFPAVCAGGGAGGVQYENHCGGATFTFVKPGTGCSMRGAGTAGAGAEAAFAYANGSTQGTNALLTDSSRYPFLSLSCGGGGDGSVNGKHANSQAGLGSPGFALVYPQQYVGDRATPIFTD